MLTKDGILIISGKGEMPDYSADKVPWAEYRTAILEIRIEEGITTVGRCAFYGCSALREVALPSTLTKICEYGFYDCKKLTSVNIPAQVSEIGAFAFRRSGLTTVNFEKNYGWSADGTVFSATDIANLGVDYLTLGYYKCIWTRDVNAEEETVDLSFFAGGMCGTDIKWTLTYIDEAKTQLKLTVSGEGKMPEFGTGAAPWYEYLGRIVEVEVCEGVTTIGRCAFYNLKFVTKVTLHSGLIAIGDYAFSGCRSLTEIELPDTVSSIGKDAFTKTGLTVTPTV